MMLIRRAFRSTLKESYNITRLIATRGLATRGPGPEGQELMQRIVKRQEDVDTVVVGFTDVYGRIMGKRYDIDNFLDVVHEEGTHACTYTLAVDIPMNPLEGFDFANWSTGYGDFHLVPDNGTMRRAAWLDKTCLVLCDIYDSSTHELVPIAPRSILRNQLSEAQKLLPGAKVQAASELEYYLYNTSFKDANKQEYKELEAAGWNSEDYHILQGTRTEHYHQHVRRKLKESGLPVENTKGETGIGQHELNITYSDALRMADRHVVLKQGMKEIADNKDMSITFMAKPSHSDAGSSCHIHLSLVDTSGKSLFNGDGKLGTVIGCSDTFKYFLGGWIKHTPDLYAFYAPTVNSYKRFTKGSWAPTACEWGHDNRTAGFRIVGSGESLRIECRLPGADVNPYLAFAAGIASGIDGIKNKIEPPEMFVGDAYSSTNTVPESLGEAAERLRTSNFVKATFGEVVQKHYSHFYKLEQQAFDAAVTNWEKVRYFEQI